jgi:hypothetical protein
MAVKPDRPRLAPQERQPEPTTQIEAHRIAEGRNFRMDYRSSMPKALNAYYKK